MKMWTLKNASQSDEGAFIYKVKLTTKNIFKNMCQEYMSINFDPFVDGKLLIDLEFYQELTKREQALIESLANNISQTTSIEPVNNVMPKVNQEVSIQDIIKKLKTSKTTWTSESKSSNSKYIYGVIKKQGYKLRISDHDKSNNRFEYHEQLEKLEPSQPFKVGTATLNGIVSYSTEWKTTLKTLNGNLVYHNTNELRKFLNEKV